MPYEAVLGQEVIIRETGRERRVTAAEAFLLQLTKLGLDGDTAAARAASAAIGDKRDTDFSGPDVLTIIMSSWTREASALRSSASASAPNSILPGDSADDARAVDCRGRLGALREEAPDPQRTGNRAKRYPNTDQGPVARLVGGYAVRLIGRVHRAPERIGRLGSS